MNELLEHLERFHGLTADIATAARLHELDHAAQEFRHPVEMVEAAVVPDDSCLEADGDDDTEVDGQILTGDYGRGQPLSDRIRRAARSPRSACLTW